MKKIFLIAMTMMLAFPSLPLAASSGEAGDYSAKDEVVYAKLSPEGKQHELYIVNSFEITKAGSITDYGNYSNLKNLTDTSEIKKNGDKISFDAPDGRFYYQGNLDNQPLPWNFQFSYSLDGKKMNVKEMLGKDGKLTIRIKTSPNEEANEVFFENYLLQISFTLDSDIYKHIKADDGIIANAGKNKQVNFTVLPGKEGDFTLEAEVADFEFAGIEISAVPSTMAIDFPETEEMTKDMESLADAIESVNEGVSQFQDGVSQLNSGVSELKNGSSQYKDGISQLGQSSAGLVKASESIQHSLKTMEKSLQDSNSPALDEIDALFDGLYKLADGLYETKDQIAALREGYVTAYETMNDVMETLPSAPISEKSEQSLLNSNADKEVIQQLLDAYENAVTAKAVYHQLQEGFLTVDGALKALSESMNAMGDQVKEMAQEVSASLNNTEIEESLSKLQDGIGALASHYAAFHDGLVSYTDGVKQLSRAYDDVHSGISGLSEGTNNLETGASELHQGTNELHKSTMHLPEEMQEEIDRMMEEYDSSDFEPVSFVSKKNNEKINSVQFVIKTESVTKEEAETEIAEKKEEKGFWERLLDLFR